MPQIVKAVEIAAKRGLTAPPVCNTAGYNEFETFKALDGDRIVIEW